VSLLLGLFDLPADAGCLKALWNDCKKECDKFPMITECKDCGDACKTCADECQKIAS
jgi:hypothetical protein